MTAHSTPYFDGIILYKALQFLGEKNLLVYPRGPSPYFPKWCRPTDNRGGFKEEYNELQHTTNLCRVIFPSGGNVTWKTGFYVLAKKLNAKIVILGIDYKNYRVVVDSIVQPRKTFEETKDTCMKQLRKYEAGPCCYILRVLFNYGCETHRFDKVKIYFSRGLLGIFVLFSIFLFFHNYLL